VHAGAFSPDGKTVLTGSADQTARLWRADTGAPLTPPLQHQGLVFAVAFSPDGKTVLTGSYDHTARLWRADTGAPLTPPLQHQDAVYAVAFSPDGKTVLTGSLDHTARLWRADTAAPLTAPLQHQDFVLAVAFSPDGQSFVVATKYWVDLRSWSRRSAELLGAKLLPGEWTGALHFEDPDGQRIKLVLTDTANTAFVYAVSFGKPTAPPIQGDARALLEDWERRLALTFDPLGRIVAAYQVSTPQPEGRSR
jgi:WD40 repeat protein